MIIKLIEEINYLNNVFQNRLNSYLWRFTHKLSMGLKIYKYKNIVSDSLNKFTKHNWNISEIL